MILPRLPTVEELRPSLDRLEAEAGSVLLIAIDQPAGQNFSRIGIGFFDAEERKALKAALVRCKKRRSSNQSTNSVSGV